MRKLRNTRPKAIFGTVEAATLAAAGITAAATAAAAGIGSKATQKAAKQQADAAIQSATLQADSIRAQSELNKEMTEKTIEANKEVNEENRQLQKDLQMTLQTMAGMENMTQAKRESKIVVKNGGSTKAKLPLRVGFGNQPFKITDGGGVIALGQTPEGYDLYELVGDNHEQYHKTNGKYKSGVGVKFANGDVIEGEGNGKSNQGELILSTPDDVMFISKHTLKGFNPANAVKNGMNPVKAFAIQEGIKDIYNIEDNGNKKAKMGCRKLRLAGGYLADYAVGNGTYSLSADITPGVIGGVIYTKTPVEKENDTNVAKCGKNVHIRNKALSGVYAPIFGGGIAGIGNLIGAGISASGAKKAGRLLSGAYSQAGNILANAYANLQGIDPSIVSREDYRAAKFLPVVRSARYNINPQLTKIDRDVQAQSEAIDNTTMSSAAKLARKARLLSNAGQQKAELYASQANMEEQISQGNAARLSDAAAKNAELEAMSNRDYVENALEVAKYNTDVKNQSILGIAQSRASGLTQSTEARAQGLATARNSWAQGVAGAAGSIASGLETYSRNKFLNDWLKKYGNNKPQSLVDKTPGQTATNEPAAPVIGGSITQTSKVNDTPLSENGSLDSVRNKYPDFVITPGRPTNIPDGVDPSDIPAIVSILAKYGINVTR